MRMGDEGGGRPSAAGSALPLCCLASAEASLFASGQGMYSDRAGVSALSAETGPDAVHGCKIGSRRRADSIGIALNFSGQLLDAIVWPTVWHLLQVLGALLVCSTISNPEGPRLVVVFGRARCTSSRSPARAGSSMGRGRVTSRFKCQWGWKSSSKRARLSSSNFFKVCTHGSPCEDVKVLLQRALWGF